MATYLGNTLYSPVTTKTPAQVTLLNNTVTFAAVNLGSTSPQQQFTVTFLAATTVSAINYLTQGGINLDYLTNASTTCLAKAYAAKTTCLLSLLYKPSVAGTRLGSAVLYDGSNASVVTIPATGTGLAPLLSFGLMLDPLAPTTGSNFSGPTAVSLDAAGNMFVADTLNNRVVEIPSAGAAKNVGANLIYPVATALDGAGNLYVADSNGITKIPNEHGNINATHQSRLSITGGLRFPAEIAFDSAGNLFIADSYNNRIVMLLSLNGILDAAHPTYLGTGLVNPNGVAVDAAGNVFIADSGFGADPVKQTSGRIVKIPAATGLQQTLGISVNAPSSIVIDASGQLFIADTNNMQVIQVSFSPAGLVSQTPLNLAINATKPQYFGGLALDLKGNLWAPDFMNNQIVKMAQNVPLIDLGTNYVCAAWTVPWLCSPAGGTFGPKSATLTNIGNQPAQKFTVNLPQPQYFAVQGGTCNVATPGFTLNAGNSCALSVAFTVTDWFQGLASNQPASVSATGTTANFQVFGFSY